MNKSNVIEELNKIQKASSSLNKSATEYAKALKERKIFDDMKQEEFERFKKFYFTYAHYIDDNKINKVVKLLDDGERTDILFKEKFMKLNLNTSEGAQKALNLSNMSINLNIKTFNTIYDLINSGLKTKVSNGTINHLEAQLFKIELDKRNVQKSSFLKYKEDKINGLALEIKNSLPESAESISKNKDVSVKKVSLPEIDSNKTSNTGKEVTQELYDIAQEILRNMF